MSGFFARFTRNGRSPRSPSYRTGFTGQARCFRLEHLEPREMMAVGPEEQLFVYMLNRARHDPVAYQQEQNLPVSLAGVAPRPPLAVNDRLFNSAEFHTNEMVAFNYFAHQSTVNGAWPNRMVRDQGYSLNASWSDNANFVESLAAGTNYSIASLPLNALIVDAGVPDLGHRRHLLGTDAFNAENREIGVGHSFGATTQFSHYWAIHATRTDPADTFLTGVVFHDANGNLRYDLNEGLPNVSISIPGTNTLTNAAGGWSIKVNPGSYQITASGGGFSGSATAFATTNGNVEVDFISGRANGIVSFNTNTPPPPVPAVTINNVTVTEGNSGTVNAVFAVTLSAAGTQTITVPFSTASNTAYAGFDFTATSGVLTFNVGATSQNLTVQVTGDTIDEWNESFMVNLSNPVNATLADGIGESTILDNDTSATPNRLLIAATGPGSAPRVKGYDRDSGAERFSFLPYNAGFGGGVQVATADVNGDGILDIITAPGSGGGPHIRAFDGATGDQLGGAIGSFFAYNAGFTGGVFVAAGDITGDGRAEIVTAAGAGGGPHIRIFNGQTGALISEYFAFTGAFLGGVRVAVGDVDGNSTLDVITAAGAGGGPHVRVFSGFSANQIAGPLGSFFAYGADFLGGVYVAAGDINGDARADVLVGAGAGGGPHVQVFSGANGAVLQSFFAYAMGFQGGVRVAAGDADNNGRADIIVAAGMGGGPHVKVHSGQTLAELHSFFAFEGSFTGGLYVAGSPASGTGSPLHATEETLPNPDAGQLSIEQFNLAIAAAMDYWIAQGLSDEQRQDLYEIPIELADLPGTYLGLTYPDLVLIDLDGAGQGWHLAGFKSGHDDSAGFDLIQAVAHELGHVLGLPDLDADQHPHDLMAGSIAAHVE